MTEGVLHKALVRRLERAVHRAIGSDKKGICIVDRGGGYRHECWTIGGFYPDIRAFGRGLEVIGEAKSSRDLETDRSMIQLKNFLNYVQSIDAAHLVLAVQPHISATAWNFLRVSTDRWQVVRNKIHILDGTNRLELFKHEKT